MSISFAQQAYDLLCPRYEMDMTACYPNVYLGIRLRNLRAQYAGEEFDVKHEYAHNVGFFFQCVAKLYLNTPFDCRGFFHSLDDKMFAVLVTTIQNDDDLINRAYDWLCNEDTESDCATEVIADDSDHEVIDMFSVEYEQQCQDELACNVVEYVQEMKCSRAMPILSQDYSDHMQNYSAYAHRLPLIIEIVSQLPNERIWAPGDGIGVVSLACLFLHREYWSSEPNRIGIRARELGIIKSNASYEDFVENNHSGIVVISNLARYCDLTLLARYPQLVVIDELCYYPGCQLVPVVPLTYGRVRSTLPLEIKSNFFDGINRIDKIVPASSTYVTSDGRAYVAMQRLGYKIAAAKDSPLSKIVPVGEGKNVTYNFVGVTAGTDMILSYRKYAGAPSGRPGQYQLYAGVMYRFNRGEYIRVKGKGFKMWADRNYNSTSILYGVLPTYEPLTYLLRFDPSKLKYARVAQLVVLIRVISVKQIKNEYQCVIVRYDDHGNYK